MSPKLEKSDWGWYLYCRRFPPERIDAFRLPAEEPVFRGPGNAQTKVLCAERRCQCRRLMLLDGVATAWLSCMA